VLFRSEAEMVFKIVKYFTQQNYKNDQIVVLTPYLGQLRKLADKMKTLAYLSGRDRAELSKLDETQQPAFGRVKPTEKVKPIRIASIDNYQVRTDSQCVTLLRYL